MVPNEIKKTSKENSMTERNKNWTKNEMIVAFNLYCKIPFGQIHIRNPKIIELAKILGRTPSAVSWKLANFARFDPSLKKRNIKGASHGSKMEVVVWDEFNNNPEDFIFTSEKLLSDYTKKPLIQDDVQMLDVFLEKEGLDKERIVRARVNQYFFRSAVIATYENKCWLTGISSPELLIASHIVPWSIDKKNRLNPQNGLCLNALFDRAFDKGLLTITPAYVVKISSRLLDGCNSRFFSPFNNKQLSAPRKFAPKEEFLAYHNSRIFQKN